MKTNIPLFFYPAQIVFIDDSEDFLSSIDFLFSNKFNTKLFSSPNLALDYIDTNAANKNDMIPQIYGESDQWIKQVLNRPHLKRFDESRAYEVAVVVVDYMMPDMNGIEFCKNIDNPAIKKILLTGHAAPSDVVDAFNNGVIHYYINKSHAYMIDELSNAITRLQRNYFQDLSSGIKTEAVDVNTPFFTDPNLSEYFLSICTAFNVKEYYYLSNPSRFTLQDAESKKWICLIYTEEDIEEHLKIMEEEEASDELVATIESRQYIPVFSSEDGYYSHEHADAMRIFPAQKVVGKTNYYCAVISQDEIINDKKIVIQSNGNLH